MSWFSDTFLGTEDSGEKRTDYLEDRKQDEFDEYAADWGAQADTAYAMGDELMDPNSWRNQQNYARLESTIQDETSRGIRDWQGAMAQQGQGGGAGGIGAQNILQARRRAGGDAAFGMQDAYQRSFGLGLQSKQFGSGERSRAMGATGSADQIYAGANEAKMTQDTINAQKKAGFNQALGGAALSFAMPGIMGGVSKSMVGMGKGLAGSKEGMFGGYMKRGLGNVMQNIGQPGAQRWDMQQTMNQSFMDMFKEGGKDYFTTQGYNSPGQSNIQQYAGGGVPQNAYQRAFGLQGPPSGLLRYAQSDKRLKKNIKLVGKSKNNINIYEFDYKDGEGRYRGVMAQELPDYATALFNGYLGVDYSLIDVPFERIA